MKQVLIAGGDVVVENVPAPEVDAGTVLVRVDHSCISVGTELSGIQVAEMPLWKRALRNPAKVRSALQMVATQGVAHTLDAVRGQVQAGHPIGYSASGIVLEVGAGIDDLQPGDRVACAGAGVANHAEIVRVPRNLTVLVPEQVTFADASTVTLGAIALQGIRRAAPTLGETFVVLGLGVLGQLTVQMLKADGCRVIALDLDPGRVARAVEMGADAGAHQRFGDVVDQVARVTNGIGADGVVVTAATSSDEVVSTAFRICRKKGRVVLVGDVGLDLKREDIYAKELDFLVSTSYGPGRYDRRYEDEGLEYPIGHVRWSENRNMQEVLHLIGDGKLRVAPLVSSTYPVDEAPKAYASLRGEGDRPLMVLLQYPDRGAAATERRVPNPRAAASPGGAIRLALVGAGGFARTMHLPNIKALSDRLTLRAVVSRSGHNAVGTAQQYGAAYATTDFDEILADADVDAVLIATRHDEHADMALRALECGKHVLVEKPLALDTSELARVREFYEEGGQKPVLLTGFNRRFSPFARRIAERTVSRRHPMVIDYRMNAGYLPSDHWVHGPEGGGRNVGEACHIYDLFTALTGSPVRSVSATPISSPEYYRRDDNFVATISFQDGSVGSLTYTSMGASAFPKEQMEVYVEGKVFSLDDYRSMSVIGAEEEDLDPRLQDKGHREELVAFASAVHVGGEWPIPLWQQLQAMEIAFEVERQIYDRPDEEA